MTQYECGVTIIFTADSHEEAAEIMQSVLNESEQEWVVGVREILAHGYGPERLIDVEDQRKDKQ